MAISPLARLGCGTVPHWIHFPFPFKRASDMINLKFLCVCLFGNVLKCQKGREEKRLNNCEMEGSLFFGGKWQRALLAQANNEAVLFFGPSDPGSRAMAMLAQSSKEKEASKQCVLITNYCPGLINYIQLVFMCAQIPCGETKIHCGECTWKWILALQLPPLEENARIFDGLHSIIAYIPWRNMNQSFIWQEHHLIPESR